MRADDIGFELGKVELDDAVIVFPGIGFDFFVRLQQVLVLLEQRDQSALTGRPQISRHALVGRED